MDKFYRYARAKILSFRLDSCCWLAPVRIGVLIIGYYNYITSLIYLVASATESFSPTFKKVQEKLAEEASVSTCILAYGIQLSSAVLLLCAMHRNDAVLLWTYLYYIIFTTALAAIGYGLLIGVIGDLLIVLVIVIDIIFQCYVMLLVRSAIVEIETANNKHNFDYVVKLNDVHTDKAPNVQIMRNVEAQTDESKIDVEPIAEERVEINTSANTTEQTEDRGKKSEIKPAAAAASVKITEEIKPKPKTKTDAIVKRKIERNTTKTPDNTEITRQIVSSSKTNGNKQQPKEINLDLKLNSNKNDTNKQQPKEINLDLKLNSNKNDINKQQPKEINLDLKLNSNETKANGKPDPEPETIAPAEDGKPEPNANSTETTNKESQAEMSKEDIKKASRERRRLFLFNWRAANK